MRSVVRNRRWCDVDLRAVFGEIAASIGVAREGVDKRLRTRPEEDGIAIADIAVFDLERLTDKATYEDPHQLAEGMVHVLVNGEFAIRDGQFTGGLHGTVLQKKRRRGVS